MVQRRCRLCTGVADWAHALAHRFGGAQPYTPAAGLLSCQIPAPHAICKSACASKATSQLPTAAAAAQTEVGLTSISFTSEQSEIGSKEQHRNEQRRARQCCSACGRQSSRRERSTICRAAQGIAIKSGRHRQGHRQLQPMERMQHRVGIGHRPPHALSMRRAAGAGAGAAPSLGSLGASNSWQAGRVGMVSTMLNCS